MVKERAVEEFVGSRGGDAESGTGQDDRWLTREWRKTAMHRTGLLCISAEIQLRYGVC